MVLPPAPYFSPDMPLFFGLKALTGDTYQTFYAFALIQNLLAFYLAVAIVVIVSNNKRALILLSTIFLITIYFYTTQINNGPYFVSPLSVFHFGNIINGLLVICATLLAGRSSDENRNYWYILIIVISFLGTASDLHFLFSFMATLICYLSETKREHFHLRIIALLTIGAIAGTALTSSILNQTTVHSMLLNPIVQLRIQI